MPTLLYIHGFLSSPASGKAVQVRDWLARERPDIDYQCPFLTAYFDEARDRLEAIVTARLPEPVYLMGSSLGGYWAAYLGEKYGLRAVLINPLVDPRGIGDEVLGIELRNYHTGARYVLEKRHLEALRDADTPELERPEDYWLLVQTGDETLDYRLAVAKYRGSRQTVEEGGSHSFEGFERHIPEAVRFLENSGGQTYSGG